MLRQINNSQVTLIGDPHFGKQFNNGVPLNRRGERERSQLDTFEDLLINASGKTVIIMGDLFDKFVVSGDVLVDVWFRLIKAAEENEDKMYIILQGNHDVSRDVDKVSSFRILESMCAFKDNLMFVKQVEYYITSDGNDTLMLIPYFEFEKASDVVEKEILLGIKKVAAAFGHWDLIAIKNDHNLIPLSQLEKITDTVFTGHIHEASTFVYNTMVIEVTGSMQPYAHGEGGIYLTVTLEEYLKKTETDPGFYHDKVVRVKLKRGEQCPVNIDAMQISFLMVDDDGKEEVEVKTEVFSFKTLYDECCANNEVSEEVQTHYWGIYQERASDAAKS